MKANVTLLLLVMASLSLSSLTKAGDNKIILENVQTGDNFNLSITQAGNDNTIDCYNVNSCDIDGSNVSLHFEQWNNAGSENKIQIWHLDGNNNSIRWGQGAALTNSSDTTFSYDGQESGGHYARIDIHGNNNSISGFQQNGGGSNSGHVFNSLIWSDNNTMWLRQQGDGTKTLNITTRNDGNTLDVRQKGNNANHAASIDLRGTYPTDLTLFQRGGIDQSYTLIQNCLTTGGCSVSVIQGQ